jgi:hypothetical protein
MPYECNMGYIDRTVRLLVGSALLYISLFSADLVANQVVRYVLGVLGCVNLITAAIAFCPLYTLADINTRRQNSS